jgi:hypothetical protein
MMDKIEYDSQQQGSTIKVGMVYFDARGVRLSKPYLGVKIDDSDWNEVKHINEMALEFAERKLSKGVK